MAGLLDFLSPTSGGDPSQNMGLMGMLSNPQTAGLLGMAGGLLSAAGPSRIPVTNGQALGAGFQGMQQNMGNSLQMQRTMAALNAIQGNMPGAPQGQSVPNAPTQPPVTGSANVAGLSGPSAGMGQFAPPTPVSMQSAQQQAAVQAQTPFESQFGMTPEQMYQKGNAYAMLGFPNGTKMMEIAAQYNPALAAAMPTDLTKMGTQAGMTQPQIQAANAAGVAKANAPVSMRSPIMFDPTTGTVQAIPSNVLQAGYGAQYGAQEQAKAQNQNQQVWDPTANNGQGGFVYQTRANVNAAATGGNVPIGIQNNNFGNIRSTDGKGFASYNTAQDGINAADGLLSTYGSKYGINTINGIANRWAPAGDGNNNPTAKAAAMAAASGVPANQPIDLADPNMRARILPALFDTETPGWRNAIGSPNASPARPAGPMAAQPPLGATTATNTAQNAASKQMTDSYNGLASSDSSYQQSRGALTDMIALANQMGPLDSAISKMPEGTHNWDSLVTQYDKAHATFVSNQYNALSAGTDASKGTVNDMVPSSDKPLSAKVAGLNTQLNNLDYRHLETQLMTPTFNGGDQKGFTSLNAAFHNTVKPEMMPAITPILQMSGPQQQAAVQAAVKANPALRPAFETLFNGGMLK